VSGRIVVKLGGSHALSPSLPAWLAAILDVARHDPAGRVVVVPGGGPFADAVRSAQRPMGFDDAAAHDMALMAMAQYARALAALADGFVLCDDVAGIDAAAARALVPIWSPWPMLRDHPAIARSWEVTSDSLALWLATELRAAAVVLIKSRPPPPAGAILDWARDGLVDPAFPRHAARFAGRIAIAGPDDRAQFRAVTAAQEAGGAAAAMA
jgi:aspartokinase-like uncharacterized kinase